MPDHRVGLLDHLTATALDEDYAAAADRRRREGSAGATAGRSPGMLAALLVFGLLLATAAVETARSAPVREISRSSLVAQVQQGREELLSARADATRVRRSIEQLQRTLLADSRTGRTVAAQVLRLGAAAGTEPVQGPGVRIVVDDNPRAATSRQVVLDQDLQRLVNGLWVAGAEAVAVNGQRVTALTAIREAGEAITVNFRSLRRPYTVEGVGDPDQLPARFIESDGGTWWLNLRSVYHLRFTMTSEDQLSLPAVELPRLRHAAPAGAEEPAGPGAGRSR